jgi:hypothetical protein
MKPGAECSFPGCGPWSVLVVRCAVTGLIFRQERAHIIPEMQVIRRLVRNSMDEESPIHYVCVSHVNTYVEWFVGQDIVNVLIRFD